MPDREDPKERSNEEKAEDSRRNVDVGINDDSATDNPMERGAGQVSQPHRPLPKPSGSQGRAPD
jgi:hypothetical protein